MPKLSPIAELLSVTRNPENNAAWHLCLNQGLEAASLKSIAGHLGLPQKELAALVMPGVAATRKGLLLPEAGNALYRIAEMLVKLQPRLTLVEATKWLKTPQAALKGRVPLELLTTHIGHGYVTAAIGRLV